MIFRTAMTFAVYRALRFELLTDSKEKKQQKNGGRGDIEMYLLQTQNLFV